MSEAKMAGTAPAVLQIEPGTHYWCACGRSANQPWCDGSHAGTGFQPVAFTTGEPSKVALCMCKHTGTPPRCDGSHAKLG
jgi:CDGSH-type Zn-finger protein